MVASPSSAQEPSTISMPVRLRGRVFPIDLPGPETDTAHQETLKRVPELAPELALENDVPDIRTQLAQALWQRLEFPSLDDDVDHHKDVLIESYSRSLSQIVGFGKDAGRLFQAVCRTNLEFRSSKGIPDEAERTAAVQPKLNEMIQKASPTIMLPKNVLTAELIAQPSAVVYEKLRQALRGSLSEFVEEFYAALERLVDKRIAGLIEWTGDNLCRYHFFKEVVINEGIETEVTASGPWRKDGQWNEQAFQTVTTKKTFENEYRLARHEHHVTHAFHTSIRNSRVVVPLSVQEMICEIPDWLADYVHMIDGSLFRELIVERKYDRKKWTDVQTRDEPLPDMGWEPAVVIGSIVLTGWGPREIDAELARRKETEAENDPGRANSLGRWKRNGWAAIAASAHVLSVIFMIRAFGGHSGFAIPVMALFLLGVWGGIQALTAHASFHRLAIRWHRLIVSVGALTLLPAAVHTLIVAAGIGSGGFLLAALTLLAAAALLGVFVYRDFLPVQVPVQAAR